jgi:hypothetical protein
VIGRVFQRKTPGFAGVGPGCILNIPEIRNQLQEREGGKMKKILILALCLGIVPMLFAANANDLKPQKDTKIISSSRIPDNKVLDVKRTYEGPIYRKSDRQAEVLFVEDPGQSGFGPLIKPDPQWTSWLDQTLGAGNYDWYGPIVDSSDGPPVSTMLNYTLVIWNCYDWWWGPPSYAPTAQAMANMQSYMDQGGKVWLIGQDINVSHGGLVSTFLGPYFEVASITDDVLWNPYTANLTGEGVLSGYAWTDSSDYQANGWFSDDVIPTANGQQITFEGAFHYNVITNDFRSSFWTIDGGRIVTPEPTWVDVVDNMFTLFGIGGAGAFWDFETGWQGWTHTSGLTFPAAWDVVTTTYPGGPYWTYQPPPDAGDSAFIIDSDSDLGANWVHDTTMSPPVPNPGYSLLKWGFYLEWDDLWVLLREHDGSAWGSWSVVASYSGTTGPQWDSVDVSAYTGDSLQVGFRYDDFNYWGYGATFDNVGFYLPPVSDVGTDAILEPVGVYSLNDVVTPQAQVRNFGDFDETFPAILTMTHNAILVYADTVQMTLAIGAVDTAVFAPHTFDQAGTYDIVSYTELVGDQNPDNDTAYATAIIFEWVEDFESTNGALVPAPVTGAWEWGVPTSGPGAAHSGTQLWATVLAGNYSNDANWTLTSQDYYDVTEDNPLISFYHWYDIESYYDGGNVKYSTDDGITWLLLYPVGGYDDVAFSGNAGIPNEECFTGQSAGWEAEEIIIPVNAGQTVKLRFHFGSDGSVMYPGWYIDDLAGLGLTYVGIAEEPGNGHIAVFGFAPNMSTVTKQPIINYSTTTQGRECLKVYDNTGRLIRTLVDRANEPAGTKSVYWNRKDDTGRTVANGVYFIRLESVNQYATHKLILIK